MSDVLAVVPDGVGDSAAERSQWPRQVVDQRRVQLVHDTSRRSRRAFERRRRRAIRRLCRRRQLRRAADAHDRLLLAYLPDRATAQDERHTARRAHHRSAAAADTLLLCTSPHQAILASD